MRLGLRRDPPGPFTQLHYLFELAVEGMSDYQEEAWSAASSAPAGEM